MDSKGEKKTSTHFSAKCHALKAEAALTTSCLWTLCSSCVGLCDILEARLHVSCQGNDTVGKTIATTLLYLLVFWPFIFLWPLMFRMSGSSKEGDRHQNPVKICNAVIHCNFFQVERDSLVGLCPWNLQLVLVGWVYCLLLFKEQLHKSFKGSRKLRHFHYLTHQLDFSAQYP